MEDCQIISMYFARDSAAISETDKKYGRLCYSVADGILHCREDNEECVNDTYLAAWNTIPPRNPACFSAYLCRITRNLSLKKYEHRHAKKRNPDVEVPLSELSEIVRSNSDVAGEAELRELGEHITLFLRSLPQDERNVFILRYWSFRPVKAIASQLGFSQSKVKSMLMRTRGKLSEYLKEHYFAGGAS